MTDSADRPETPHSAERESRASSEGDDAVGRRNFVLSASMATGLAASYGTFLAMAGRFLYPARSSRSWICVGPAREMPAGGSLAFRSPAGLSVVITRKSESADKDLLTGEDFRALSSVCPHLGCRVHWEPQNDRFFCPCHNGAFDAEGNPIAGPPKADNQRLPDYPLRVEKGVLFIEMPGERTERPPGTRVSLSDVSHRAADSREAENV
jgi:Rieske Fe-S protein